MARNHFAIERPRKISISIEGYNAQARVQQQKKQQQERSRRLNRKASAAAKRQQPTVPVEPTKQRVATVRPAPRPEEAEELEALNKAAAYQPLSTDTEKQLRDAFAAEREG